MGAPPDPKQAAGAANAAAPTIRESGASPNGPPGDGAGAGPPAGSGAPGGQRKDAEEPGPDDPPATTRVEIIISEMLEGSKKDLQRHVLSRVLEETALQKERADRFECERDDARKEARTFEVKVERLLGKIRGFRKALHIAEVMVIFGGLFIAVGGAFLSVQPVPFTLVMLLGALMVLASYLLKRAEITKDTSGEDS